MNTINVKFLTDNLSIGIAAYKILFDGNGTPYDYKCMSINNKFVSILNLNLEELTSKTLNEILDEHKMFALKDKCEKLNRNEEDFFEEFKETINEKEVSITIMKFSNSYLIIQIVDINKLNDTLKTEFQEEKLSEKKELIIDINKKNIELEQALNLLKETQSQLVNEDKMASVGQLSAGIAHEINNPLGFVLSNFNTLKKYVMKFKETIQEYRILKTSLVAVDTEEMQEKIKKVEQIENKNKIEYIMQDLEELFSDTDEGLERIRNIVLALRNFAYENVNSEFEEYDLNEGIKNTLIIVRNEIKYNSEVILNLGTIPTIKALGGEINQVLLNTIVNSSHAIKEKIEKYSMKNEKSGIIEISTWSQEEFVFFKIRDNGIGISKININRVFEPFFTTKPVGKGTGLGLSISYDIIKNKHHGDISIESEVGQGTQIIIKLPK